MAIAKQCVSARETQRNVPFRFPMIGRRVVVAVGVNYNPNAHEAAIAREVVNSTGEVVNSIDEVVNETIRANPGCRKPKLLTS